MKGLKVDTRHTVMSELDLALSFEQCVLYSSAPWNKQRSSNPDQVEPSRHLIEEFLPACVDGPHREFVVNVFLSCLHACINGCCLYCLSY